MMNQLLKTLSISLLLCPFFNYNMAPPTPSTAQPEQQHDIEQVCHGIEKIDLTPYEYDSDSEDEKDYQYNGFKPIAIFPKPGTRCLVVCRGIHFSPSYFSKEQKSHLRRDDEVGKPIYSTAAHDLAHEPLFGSTRQELINEQALQVREIITKLPSEKRNKFQQIYSNQYDEFHKKLGIFESEGIFHQFTSQKNPQVSTSEHFWHGARYAAGLKYLGANVACLNPEYDTNGKPKHPYLGKLFIIMADESKIRELDPYFVVWAHANNLITISEHYSKNVIVEREVSFPGLIPGECVVFSTAIRVPSFAGLYKSWHERKYGISKRIFNARKKVFTTGKYYKDESRTAGQVREKSTKSLLEKIILPHLEQALKEHVKKECANHGISLIYKSIAEGFSTTLPNLVNASSQRENIRKHKSGHPTNH